MEHKWACAAEGLLVLDGTPFAVRAVENGEYLPVRDNRAIDRPTRTLGYAKMVCQWRANDMAEMGLL